MSANDCCSMFITCCMCCSLCSHSSDSSCVRWLVNLFPDSWCGKLDDNYTEEATVAERDHEAALFQGNHNAQPASTPAMDAKSEGGNSNIRDKSHIMADD